MRGVRSLGRRAPVPKTSRPENRPKGSVREDSTRSSRVPSVPLGKLPLSPAHPIPGLDGMVGGFFQAFSPVIFAVFAVLPAAHLYANASVTAGLDTTCFRVNGFRAWFMAPDGPTRVAWVQVFSGIASPRVGLAVSWLATVILRRLNKSFLRPLNRGGQTVHSHRG